MVEPAASSPPEQEASALQIPIFYFNGFAIALSNADIAIQLKLDNRPGIALKGSYTVMKTLAEKLDAAIKHFEKTTKHDLMTTDVIDVALKSEDSKPTPK